MNTCGLTTERMQSIAREFNLSETTFIERREEAIERSEGVRVRIFTAQEELNFAGHPTLGTASVLKMLAPETVQHDSVTLKENVGPIPVRFDTGADGSASAGSSAEFFGEMTQRDPEFGAELDSAVVARLAGLEPGDLDAALKPQVVSTGTAFAIVALRSQEALARLKVNQEEATAWLRDRGARWFYVLAPSPDQNEHGTKCYRARMQFYGGEDPATGSAAGCAIAYLVARGACSRACACMCAKAWRWAGRAIFFFPRKKKTRGSTMCALQAAQFLLQKDSFSCRDAHAFNRYSSSQVTLCVCCRRFPLVSIGFSLASSLRFPSFHDSPVLVLFRFVADNSLARFVWNLSDAPQCCALDREGRLSHDGSCAGPQLCEQLRPFGVRPSQREDRSRRSKECEPVFLPAYRA